jgi:hypothetical protein
VPGLRVACESDLPVTYPAERLEALERGQVHSFRDWPNRAVPQLAAGVYTIWQQDELIYVGMAGRSLTAEYYLLTLQVSEG